MPKVSPIQDSFSGGEVSPQFQGRVSSERYRTSLKKCFNYLPLPQGGLVRRSGTSYIGEIVDSDVRARLIPYVVSQTQSYMLELGSEQIRVWTSEYSVFPVGYVIPYQDGELDEIKYLATPQGLILFHPSYTPRIFRYVPADLDFDFSEIVQVDGPYLSTNTTTTTLTPNGTTGNITITASAIDGINGGAGFQATDVGRLIRLKHTNWAWVMITNVADPLTITCTVMTAMGSVATVASSTATWRLGAWSDTTGYPACGALHENRLVTAGGILDHPLRVDLSVTGGLKDIDGIAHVEFNPSDSTGTISDASAINSTLSSNRGNFIRWAESAEKGLLFGTAGSEFSVSPATEGSALTPTNFYAKESSGFGSANIQPAKLGGGVMFVSPSGRKIREMDFFFDADGFRAPDRTLLAEHITGREGVAEVVAQKEPNSILWCRRNDGLLASMNYEREGDSLVISWARHQIGGYSDEDSTHAIVESIALLPSADGKREDLWMIVRRVFGSDLAGYTTRRYIEYMTPIFDDSMEQREAFFADCGLTYDNPVAITNVEFGSGVFTSAGHGLAVNDYVWISDIVGMSLLNNAKYRVASVPTSGTFTLQTLNGESVLGNQLGTYVSGGYFRKYVSTISGLDHLNSVTSNLLNQDEYFVLADGAVQRGLLVVGGTMTLAAPAVTVHVGLRFHSDGQLLPLEAGAADGTSQAKTRRIHRVAFKVHRTLGLKFGTAFEESRVYLDESLAITTETTNEMNEVNFRKESDDMDEEVPLASGIFTEELDADYDFENTICFRQEDPLPGLILFVAPQMVTQDRG